MEVYAAMVDRMDQGIGRIVEALRQTGQLDNTLLLFLQDNGACAEDTGRKATGQYATRPEKPPFPAMRPDELQTTLIPKQTRDGYPVIQGPGAMPGPDGTFIAYGQGWANVSNTPFREYKHWVHEGGISTPLIAHWPARIRRHGELERQPGHLIDLMATCVDVSGASYPREFQGHPITPMEGRSLLPAFAAKPIQREAIFWEHEGNRAVRVDDWKLVAKGEKGPWELYDLAADRTELHDLAAQQPERVKQLAAAWQAWAERAYVLPLNPRPREAAGVFSKETHFTLHAGDALTRQQAPFLPGKALRITAELEDPTGSGVLVAQGGSSEGYSLYLRDGRPVFALRREKQLIEIAGKEPLPAGAVQVVATLKADGTLLLLAGGKEVATGKAPGPITGMPIDGLQVGRDAAGAVGNYPGPFPFTGKLRGVTVELGP
jgi:arylsulfatase